MENNNKQSIAIPTKALGWGEAVQREQASNVTCNAKPFRKEGKDSGLQPRSRVLSLAQLLSRVRKQRGGLFQQGSMNVKSSNGNLFTSSSSEKNSLRVNREGVSLQEKNTQIRNAQSTKGQTRSFSSSAKVTPIIPPKSLVIILKKEPYTIIYDRRLIDYKHSGLLQRYIGLGGKILPRRQTRLTAKQQRYIARTIKSARIMGLLPFVSKEKGFFR
jgi:ribosomal protein S18